MQDRIRKTVHGIVLLDCLGMTSGYASAEPASREGCHVSRQGDRVELCSPLFVVRLDTSAGLRAQAWENRVTGRTLQLGRGPELELDIDAAEQRLAITGPRA